MKSYSLSLRLMALAAATVLASLVLAGFILHALFVDNLERTIRSDLQAALSRLVALIDVTSPQPAIAGPLPDPRYETPFGGRYWQVMDTDGGKVLRSRSLFDQIIDPADIRPKELSHLVTAAGWHLVVVERDIEIGNRHYKVIVGEDHDRIHEASARYAADIAQLFAILGIVILAAALGQLRLGLRPLARLRGAVDGVRRGEVASLEGRFPTEVQPLVDEVNALLTDRSVSAERAQRRASDLAHGLKTPLAAMRGIAVKLRDAGQEQEARALDELATEMSGRVDYQMRLASIRTRADAHLERSSLNTAVLRTLAVLRKTAQGETLHWTAELGDDVKVNIHRQDLMELAGIVLENAAKWASSAVSIRSGQVGEMALLRIIDDGPGIPAELQDRLGGRGTRLDESIPGTGLGLAIATEILAVNQGSISYHRSEQGGLMVEIMLPLSNPEATS